jgi:hypothetical protein
VPFDLGQPGAILKAPVTVVRIELLEISAAHAVSVDAQ